MPLHQEWYRATIAHNTVAVDGQNQKAADGKLEEWKSSAGATTLAASADNVYPGVTLRRTLLARQRAASMTASSAAPKPSAPSTGPSTPPASSPPRSNSRRAPARSASETATSTSPTSPRARTDAAWSATWEDGGARYTIRMEAAPGTEVFVGEGPGRDPAERVPVIVVAASRGETVFRALHEF